MTRSRRKLRRMPIPSGPGVAATPKWYWGSQDTQPFVSGGEGQLGHYPKIWAKILGIHDQETGWQFGLLFENANEIGQIWIVGHEHDENGNLKVLTRTR